MSVWNSQRFDVFSVKIDLRHLQKPSQANWSQSISSLAIRNYTGNSGDFYGLAKRLNNDTLTLLTFI
jgi:hypothetical protein